MSTLARGIAVSAAPSLAKFAGNCRSSVCLQVAKGLHEEPKLGFDGFDGLGMK
eukprot:gene23538-9769_t